MLQKYKVILWDFDGVIMDSMPVRTKGFAEVLKDYPTEQVQQLLDFHEVNGGLSRYYKFRYFFEKIRNEEITEEQVLALAEKFSVIMLSLLQDETLLIPDALGFIKQNATRYIMHVVSGSDQTELRTICGAVDIQQYFKSIHGSPTSKIELVRQIIAFNDYKKSDVVLIGDSVNDFDAAVANGIDFCGYNNQHVSGLSGSYINSFADLLK
ncbi:HAD family hydrolase [Mucilaginibacter limnophilus]|uniref:phosphoglycolate phosphatase n=1 Tax=Mucilaginibacter limnophilus TaxID=1932778 RepID=A0A437MQ79_9SPHI|nr:HAD hydrolase-like protein [Mucilaginibacter limnophilus]RVT99803.1 HAD family hydrolase [Mucilaginibacter limnophilus]